MALLGKSEILKITKFTILYLCFTYVALVVRNAWHEELNYNLGYLLSQESMQVGLAVLYIPVYVAILYVFIKQVKNNKNKDYNKSSYRSSHRNSRR